MKSSSNNHKQAGRNDTEFHVITGEVIFNTLVYNTHVGYVSRYIHQHIKTSVYVVASCIPIKTVLV